MRKQCSNGLISITTFYYVRGERMNLIGASTRSNYDISVERIINDLTEKISPRKHFKKDIEYMAKDNRPIESILKGFLSLVLRDELKSKYNIEVTSDELYKSLSIIYFDITDGVLERFSLSADYKELNKYKKEIDSLIAEVFK